MSGLFVVTATNGLWVKVRARCLSCARDIAVRHAGAEGTLIWRDPAQSVVALVPEPMISAEKLGLVAKGGVVNV